MKNFFSKFFDLRLYDNWNLGFFFLSFVVYAVLDLVVPDGYELALLIFSVVINVAMITYDRSELKKFDARVVPSLWWVILMPLYMYKRENTNNKNNRRVAHVYLIAMILSILFSFGADSSRNPERVAEDVCPVVDTFDVLKEKNVTCVRAYNFTEQYDGFWKGRVHLSNNLILNVTADYNQDGNYIYVQSQGIADDGY